MNDWQEAYYDLVNKVECECVQQGDLVPIWKSFKKMSDENRKLREALTEIARLRTDLSGDFSLGSRQSDIARAALGEKE